MGTISGSIGFLCLVVAAVYHQDALLFSAENYKLAIQKYLDYISEVWQRQRKYPRFEKKHPNTKLPKYRRKNAHITTRIQNFFLIFFSEETFHSLQIKN